MEKAGEVRFSLIKMLWHRIAEDDINGLSAQLAYFFLLSLFPLLIVLFTLLPYIPIPHEDMLYLIKRFAPDEAMDLIEKNVNYIMSNRNSGLLSFGIIGTIFAASNGIDAIVRAFNKAYDVKETRSFIVVRGMDILLTFGMILVLILAIVIPIFGKEIGVFLFSLLGYTSQFLKLWNAFSWLVNAIILLLIFTGLYWIAPNVKLRCKSVFPGAIFATIGWIISSLGLSFYVRKINDFSFMYGSIGTIIVLMTWLYLSAYIIVIGGEINAFYSEKNRKGC
jgi:membrane protein